MTTQAQLIADSLEPHQRKALKAMARTVGHFEQIDRLPWIGQGMADWLVDQGLAETGPPYSGTGVGYRLSELGTEVFHTKRRRQKGGPRLSSLPPLIKPID